MTAKIIPELYSPTGEEGWEGGRRVLVKSYSFLSKIDSILVSLLPQN